MRELRFVMPSGDESHVVVETSGNVGFERFRLPITDDLRAALLPSDDAADATQTRRPMPTPKQVEAEPEPTISPREIQVRVRSGELPEEIAELFNASLDWVMRFAGPVIEERSRITDEARRARARRSTADAQTVIFGETVDARFSGHGIDPALVGWDAHRREDGQWVITASWVGGESERTAEWAFNLSSRTITAIDETATDLLSDRPIRPVFTDAPVTLTRPPMLAPGVVAFPAMPNAHTGPLPTREQLYDQHAFRDEPPVAPIRSAPVAPALTFNSPELPLEIDEVDGDSAAGSALEDEPHDTLTFDTLTFEASNLEATFETETIDPELLDTVPEVDMGSIDAVPEVDTGSIDAAPEVDDIVDIDDDLEGYDDMPEHTVRIPTVTNLGVAQRPTQHVETEDEKAARAHIPSWDDILLGVRRKGD